MAKLTYDELEAENAELKDGIEVMIQQAAAKHLPAYREQGEKMAALDAENEDLKLRVAMLEAALNSQITDTALAEVELEEARITIDGLLATIKDLYDEVTEYSEAQPPI